MHMKMRKKCLKGLTLGDRIAIVEWIAFETFGTGAHGTMIDYRTTSIRGAQTDTRIATLLINASLLRRALRINRTLGPAVWRHTDIILRTRTRGTLAAHVTLGVWTAWRWLAWILRWSWLGWKRK